MIINPFEEADVEELRIALKDEDKEEAMRKIDYKSADLDKVYQFQQCQDKSNVLHGGSIYRSTFPKPIGGPCGEYAKRKFI